MNLWIRSQDKLNLVEAASLEIDEQEEPVIYARNAKGTLVFVGQYKTMERALEVLDGVEKLINNETTIGNNTYQAMDLMLKAHLCSCLIKLYIMPKE